jgi:hypothetical protein
MQNIQDTRMMRNSYCINVFDTLACVTGLLYAWVGSDSNDFILCLFKCVNLNVEIFPGL